VSELKKFRLINKIEGFSYLFLLFVAMPLKYMAGFPIATKIAGMIHGVLFIGFVYQLITATDEVPFSKKEAFIFFVASLIPFGSFYVEAQCKEKE
jgi:integral membrane protein